jgi:Protein of unknown function DUF45
MTPASHPIFGPLAAFRDAPTSPPCGSEDAGSCSWSGTVTFAADLVDQDVRFQDFVIAYELLHLRVPTHGRLFNALMNAHVPGWRALESRRASSPTNRGIERWPT